jgi:S-DNA-T family DNA segregation ATPase FtsK/SpoIIIE
LQNIAGSEQQLCTLLIHYGIKTQLLRKVEGPTFTRYELSIDPFNFKIDQVLSIEENIAYVLHSPEPPIIYPIYEQSLFVIDIVNRERQNVEFVQLISKVKDVSQYKLPIMLGGDVYNNPYVMDLAEFPHLLVAGTTGSGKSVNLRSMLTSMIYLGREKLLLTMIDPKSVELSVFGDLGLADVITDIEKVPSILSFIYQQVESRYKILHKAGVSDISEIPGMSRIVVIIDELADLIQYKKTIRGDLQRIVQKSRAAGVHVIAATQRPSVDVLSGVIKNNFPARVAFKVASQEDSRTILGGGGAEKLLGRGDMLYKQSSGSYQRLQGAFIDNQQIKSFLGALPISFGKKRLEVSNK